MNTARLIFLISFLICSTFTFAQEANEGKCGTEMHPDMMRRLAKYKKDNPTPQKRSNEILYLPIMVHLVADDNGYGRFTDAEAYHMVCKVNEQMLHTKMQFYIKPHSPRQVFHYIDNTDYYDHDYSAGNRMMRNNNVDGAVNIYVVEVPNEGNCGYFSFGGDALAVAKGCARRESTTLAHELGHYFSLPHTFYGWEYGEPSDEKDSPNNAYYNGDFFPFGTFHKERVVRVGPEANCHLAGDFFCDTPADYFPDRWGCHAPRTVYDPMERTVKADAGNYMSYGGDHCAEWFTEEQVDAMKAYIEKYRPYLLEDEYIKEEINLTRSYAVLPAQQGKFLNSNEVTLSWTKSEAATSYFLEIQKVQSNEYLHYDYITDTSFTLTNLDPGRRYFWAVTPYNELEYCVYRETNYFTTGLAGELSLTDLKVKTPTCNGEAVGEIEVSISGGTVPYEYIWESPEEYITSITAEDNIARDLVSGNYYLIVKDAGDQVDTFNFQIPDVDPVKANFNQYEQGKVNAYNLRGGQAPYEVIWSNGQTGTEAVGLAAGNYTVTITDFNGCELIDTVAIYDVKADIQQISCYNEKDANIRLEVLGPDTEDEEVEYSMTWQHNSVDTNYIDNLPSGTYEVLISRNEEYVGTYTFNVEEPAPMDITTSKVGTNGVAAQIVGGTAPYSYFWPSFVDYKQDENIMPFLPEGTYFLYVKDAMGCLDTTSFEIIPDDITGFEDQLSDSGIKLYPTNLDQHTPLHLELLSLPTQDGQMQIFGSNGQLIHQESLVKGKGIYNVAVNWSGAGVYFVKIMVDRQLCIKKLFVQ